MFGTEVQNERSPRSRVLMTAYHYDRVFSMESRLAWHRAQQAAGEYDVTVICARGEESQVGREADASAGAARPVEVVRLPLRRFERALMSNRATYYAGYRRWHRRVLQTAHRLHAERPFALVHHVSFCGFREPSECWRLGAPFVWGPLGGTPMFPAQFLNQLDAAGVVRELVRNALNRRQLKSNRRVRAAWNAAVAVLAANQEVARDLAAAFGQQPPVQLETGIASVRRAPRERRDPQAPLKILWPGRLRSWKALPLLLRGLAALPDRHAFTLRVLGQGPCRRRWERLAARLGIADRVQWVGWPEYPGQLEHYQWADVMAFTSLRDTSGTGLLEALAAGAPIIGVDHQGVADIMTDQCAIRVPVTTPAATIAGFRDGVLRLSTDGDLLHRLSQGALDRARDYLWTRQWEQTRGIYVRAVIGATSGAPSNVTAKDLAAHRQANLPSTLIPQEAVC